MAPLIAGISGLFDGSSILSSLGVGMAPVIGIALYDFIERSWYILGYSKSNAYSQFNMNRKQAYAFYMSRAAVRFAISSFIVFAMVVGIALSGAKVGQPGIAAFLFSTLFLALYWVSGQSSIHYVRQGRHEIQYPFLIRSMKSSGTTYLGMMMLGTFFWGFLFLLTSAGLQTIGL